MPTLAELLSDADAQRLNAAVHPTKAVAQPKATKPVYVKPAKSKRPGAPRTKAQTGPAVIKPMTEQPTPHQREWLQVAEEVHAKPVDPPVDPLLLECRCQRRHDGFRYVGDVLVHKACGSPRKGVPMLRGATVQPRVMPCSGCDTPVTVAKRKSGLVADLARERLVVCVDCAQAMSEGSTVTVVAPRKHHSETGGARAAVTISITEKEPPVPTIDIDTMTDAEIGAEVRKTMKANAAALVKPKKAKAKAEAKAKAKADKAAKRADRKALTEVGALEGFTLKGVVVPDLDLGAIPSLDEVPAKAFRSPYNKLRSRYDEALLPYKDDENIGVTACTWVDLANDHQRFAGLARLDAEKKTQIVAPIDLSERQIRALQDTLGVSAKKARKILLAL